MSERVGAAALPDREEAAALRARAMRYINAGGLATLVAGLLFSLAGLLAGALVWRIQGDVVLAGLSALSGVLAGLWTSRRGRKALNGDPLLVVGVVLRKGAVAAKGGKQQLALALRVDAAATLHLDLGVQPREDLLGERTVFARAPVYQALEVRPDRPVRLVCLPTGEALFVG